MQPYNHALNTPEAAVDTLARLLDARAPISQSDAVDALIAAGIPAEIADRAYRFTQIAWGRVLLDGLGIGFAPDYMFLNPHGKVLETGLLDDDPCYQAALKLAPTYRQAPAFRAIAPTSSEVNAINSMLNQGSKPENLQLTTAFFFLGDPSPIGLTRVRQLIHGQAKTELAKLGKTPKWIRPWWQFWKP